MIAYRPSFRIRIMAGIPVRHAPPAAQAPHPLHEPTAEPREQPRALDGTSTNTILRLPQVCRVTGLGRSMIYQLEAERRFPRRIKISQRAVGWIESEVQAWLRQRIESSRGAKT
jgi:predicted DNA-binding transcriptional regulator AlpA